MKKATVYILSFVFIFVLFALTASAESSTVSGTVTESSTVVPTQVGYQPWQIAIIYCIMFTVISVIGVMFIRTVRKNKRL